MADNRGNFLDMLNLIAEYDHNTLRVYSKPTKKTAELVNIFSKSQSGIFRIGIRQNVYRV